MNLVGKIFTVIIFLLCVMFTSMATMTFSTHQNWKLQALNAGISLTEKDKKFNELLSEKNALDEKYKKDHDDQERRLAQLQALVGQIEPQLVALQKSLVEKEDQIRGMAAAVKGAHSTLETLRVDAEKLRDDIRAARAERDARYAALVKTTDDLHSAMGERDRLSKHNGDLAAQVAKDNECFQYYKLNPNSNYKEKDPPAGLEAEVTAAPRPDTIEISVGADDGLRKGHKLEVVRLSTHSYVGRIEVVDLSGNRAVCRPDQSMQRSAVQKGDHVYASLSRFK